MIPTIGRPTLDRAIDSVLVQPQVTVEVIVVNDSGKPLPAAAWQDDERVRILATSRRERSVARNTGAAVARGRYLCFLDDDDWLLPGSLGELWKTATAAGFPAWVCGGLRVIDEGGRVLGEANSGLHGQCLAQVVGGAWVPLQSSLIRADHFFYVGGFSPSFSVAEEEDLSRRIALRGEFASTPAIIACLFRGGTWHTSTDYDRAPGHTRQSRDFIFNQPGVYWRLLESARAAPDPAYWCGRLLRGYVSAVHFNLRQRNVLTAVSRALGGLAAAVGAGWWTVTTAYWQGVRADHVPGSLHFIIQRYEQKRRSEAGTVARAL